MNLLAVLLAMTVFPPWLPVLAAPADGVVRDTFYRDDSLERMEAKYHRLVKDTLADRSPDTKCNSKDVLIRKEWGSMEKKDRIEYVKAVKCLYSEKPPVSSPKDVSGARSRFDDFVAAHIKESLNVHSNGFLYPWHRHFVYLYDQALRNDCGYKGPTPYWDWTLSADDPRRSPVLDGSETSLGGNGKFYAHGTTVVAAFGIVAELPPGTGGGCVEEGPFKDLMVNMGFSPTIRPAGVDANESVPVPQDSTTRLEAGLAYNPRCLTRDINLAWSDQTRRADVEYLLSCPNATCFMQRSDGWEPTNATAPSGRPPLLHTVGHLQIGGLQNDPIASPGDPIFYLHHAQLDRIWSIWQAQRPEQRTYEIAGPRTPFNRPPSDPVQYDDLMVFGVIGDTIRLRDSLSTIDGPYCYVYE